jgi:hypothetical protein
MELTEVRQGGINWIDLAHDRDSWQVLGNVVMNLQAP